MKYNRQAFCDAPDKIKIKIIKEELGLETHNGTTKADLLMLLEWLYYKMFKKDFQSWIQVEEKLPDTDDYILLSFSNATFTLIGRYEVDNTGNGSFYIGDCDEEDTCVSNDLFVNAWMPLPEPYKQN